MLSADTPSTRHRGYVTGDARRERILAEATREFAENGYRGASLGEIAKRAGLSQPGLLHHFRSKQDLLVAVLQRRDEIDLWVYSTAEGRLPEGLACLEALIRLAEHNTHNPGIVQLFVVLTGESVSPEHPAHGWARERYGRMRERLATELRNGIDAGELRADIDVGSCASKLIALLDGLQTQWLLDPDSIDMPAILREFVDDLKAHSEHVRR